MRILRTSLRAPKANSECEYLGESLRRECLDFLIPLNERHLKMTVKDWGVHEPGLTPHWVLESRNPTRTVFRPGAMRATEQPRAYREP